MVLQVGTFLRSTFQLKGTEKFPISMELVMSLHADLQGQEFGDEFVGHAS